MIDFNGTIKEPNTSMGQLMGDRFFDSPYNKFYTMFKYYHVIFPMINYCHLDLAKFHFVFSNLFIYIKKNKLLSGNVQKENIEILTQGLIYIFK